MLENDYFMKMMKILEMHFFFIYGKMSRDLIITKTLNVLRERKENSDIEREHYIFNIYC